MFYFFFILLGYSSPVFLVPPDVYDSGRQSDADPFFTHLQQELIADSELQVRMVADVEGVRKKSAQEYLSDCLPGEFAGCAFTICDTNNIPMLISTSFASKSTVTLTIADVSEGKIIVEEIPFVGAKETAQQAVIIFTKVYKGTYKKEKEDEKAENSEQEKTQTDSSELTYTDYKLPPIRLQKKESNQKRLSKEDIEEMKKDEGSKEWDKFDMDPDEYMRFINSGISLLRWKDLKQGRKNKFMIRLGGGLGFLPAHVLYYGRSVYSDVDTELVESYAWQIPQTDVSVVSNFALSFGLTPELDIGVSAGTATGRISFDMWAQKAGQTPLFRKDNLANPIWMIEPEISYVPKITSMIRPIGSVGVSFLLGRSIEPDVTTFTNTFSCRYYPQYNDSGQCIPADLESPVVNPPLVVMIKLQPGAEMSLNSNLDVWVRTPISFVMSAGNAPGIIQQGGGALPEKERDIPGGYSTFGFGVLFGVQTRFDPVVFTNALLSQEK